MKKHVANKLKLLHDWQAMKVKAYSNLSLKRPLSMTEYEEYKSAFSYAYPAAARKIFGRIKTRKVRL